jgi:hypothetical protein
VFLEVFPAASINGNILCWYVLKISQPTLEFINEILLAAFELPHDFLSEDKPQGVIIRLVFE